MAIIKSGATPITPSPLGFPTENKHTIVDYLRGFVR
jgi:hypothetical protein